MNGITIGVLAFTILEPVIDRLYMKWTHKR